MLQSTRAHSGLILFSRFSFFGWEIISYLGFIRLYGHGKRKEYIFSFWQKLMAKYKIKNFSKIKSLRLTIRWCGLFLRPRFLHSPPLTSSHPLRPLSLTNLLTILIFLLSFFLFHHFLFIFRQF